MKRIMSLVAMAFLWTGSQIPIYIFGRSQPIRWCSKVADVDIAGVPAYIYRDLGGLDRWVWFVRQ